MSKNDKEIIYSKDVKIDVVLNKLQYNVVADAEFVEIDNE